jgi:hypothetical protein
MTSSLRSLLVFAALSGGCSDNLEIKSTNLKPVAVARVQGEEGLMPSLPFTGKLTLDGSGSSDPDGEIRAFRWISATPQVEDDAGADALAMHRRWVPNGAAPPWPDDVEQPELTLPAAGTYAFTLWVIDDDGLVSDPSTLTVQLQSAP